MSTRVPTSMTPFRCPKPLRQRLDDAIEARKVRGSPLKYSRTDAIIVALNEWLDREYEIHLAWIQGQPPEPEPVPKLKTHSKKRKGKK